jgi:hypothetical protein
MRVHYEWHFEELEQPMADYGDIIDFECADTLNYLFRDTSYQEVKKLIDKGKHSISLQKWGGTSNDPESDEMELIDYAYVEPDYTIVGGSDFGIVPKRFQIELNKYFKVEN